MGRCDKVTSLDWLTRRRHRQPPRKFRLLDLPSVATSLIWRFVLTAPKPLRVYCPPFPPNVVFNNCDYTTDAQIRLHKDVVEVESQVLYVCRRAYQEGMSSLYAANTFEFGYLDFDSEDLDDDMREIEQFDRGRSLLVPDEEWFSTRDPTNSFSVVLPGNPPKRRYRKHHYFSVLPLKSRDMIRTISIASPRFCFNQFDMFRNLRRVVFTYPRFIFWSWKLSVDTWNDPKIWAFLWDDCTEDEFLE